MSLAASLGHSGRRWRRSQSTQRDAGGVGGGEETDGPDFACFEDRQQVAMMRASRRHVPSQETLSEIGGEQNLGTRNLERDEPIQRRILREKNDRAATLSEHLQNLEPSQPGRAFLWFLYSRFRAIGCFDTDQMRGSVVGRKRRIGVEIASAQALQHLQTGKSVAIPLRKIVGGGRETICQRHIAFEQVLRGRLGRQIGVLGVHVAFIASFHVTRVAPTDRPMTSALSSNTCLPRL